MTTLEIYSLIFHVSCLFLSSHFIRSSEAGFFLFLRLHAARKHPKKFPCYKRYKTLRFFLDEKAKCQSWIIKKKANEEAKIG
jgi:hypothetical protein